MFSFKSVILACALICGISSEVYYSASAYGSYENRSQSNLDRSQLNMITSPEQDKVGIQYFYSCRCAVCRRFEPQFIQVVKKLHEYLDIDTIAVEAATDYGGGVVQFHCIHGSSECHAHKIHACALDMLGNKTTAILYNACLMNNVKRGTCDNRGAQRCARAMSINFSPLRQCAYGQRGTSLLKDHVDNSQYVDSVPYVLVNGVESYYENFWDEVCLAFKNPPPPCKDVIENIRK